MPVNSRTDWSTWQVPSQSELYMETLSQQYFFQMYRKVRIVVRIFTLYYHQLLTFYQICFTSHIMCNHIVTLWISESFWQKTLWFQTCQLKYERNKRVFIPTVIQSSHSSTLELSLIEFYWAIYSTIFSLRIFPSALCDWSSFSDPGSVPAPINHTLMIH